MVLQRALDSSIGKKLMEGRVGSLKPAKEFVICPEFLNKRRIKNSGSKAV